MKVLDAEFRGRGSRRRSQVPEVEQARGVLLVSGHPDTAELYTCALEQAGFECTGTRTADEAVAVARSTRPLAVILHVHPNQDPAAIGVSLRQAAPAAALIGLVSMPLPPPRLKEVLRSFDDVVLIPCTPDALIVRVTRLVERKRRQESA
jgi:DNA-binding response OmpR family regulator